MKILVTGANGFVGKNLIAELKNRSCNDIFEYDIDTLPELLDKYCHECEFVIHLAGVNRPKNNSEFMSGNFGFTSKLLDTLEKYNNKSPILMSSSIQAMLDNPYGQSKRAGENLIFDYGRKNNVDVFVYRFPNLFGKWCRPNYNSVIATFCHNIAHDLPITVSDRNHTLNLVYIDDVVNEIINAVNNKANKHSDGFCYVDTVHTASLGEIADLIYSFKESRKTLLLPDMPDDSFAKKLYSTYLSYLSEDNFSYPLTVHADERGSFTEIIRTISSGQVSVNISKPHIVKGNHWHNTKNEKFIVVSGKGVIRFRKPDNDNIIEYFVSGDNPEVVDIPVGYTHNIENLGDTDMVTIMWCNECYNPDKPDTYYLEV